MLLGINIIVQQAPRPLGSFLSGVVGLMAVAVFGYVLFFGVTHPLLQRLGVREETAVWQQDTVAFSREGVKTAVIRLNFDNPSTRLSALSDSSNLIQGEISYLGDLQFETDASDGKAEVSLGVRSKPSQWLNPANWRGEDAKPWQIGLSPSVPLDLTLDVGNGSGNFDLSKLSLETLAVEGGNGSMDVMLPGVDGLEIMRRLRDDPAGTVPVIMLTARSQETDRIYGLEMGADDYVTKPFSPAELVARVKAVLRRAQAGTPAGRDEQPLHYGDLFIDPVTRLVRVQDQELELTATEFNLLWFMAQHPRQVFSRDQLLENVWGFSEYVDPSTVTVHIRRLREKIEPNPSKPVWLVTVWGVGYKFVPGNAR